MFTKTSKKHDEQYNVSYIDSFAHDVFGHYFADCYAAKDSKSAFVEDLAENYGDVNALHPFREGNGRAQREFARLVCRECGYDFDLSCTNQKEMLYASRLSFEEAVSVSGTKVLEPERIAILTADDLPAKENKAPEKQSAISL